jgi:hypothetical protein
MEAGNRWFTGLLVLAIVAIGLGVSNVFRPSRTSPRSPVAAVAASSTPEPQSFAAEDPQAFARPVPRSISAGAIPCITVSIPVFVVSPGPPVLPSAYADSLPFRASHVVLVRTDVKCLGRGDRFVVDLPDGAHATVEVEDIAEKSAFRVDLRDSLTEADMGCEFSMPAQKVIYAVVPVGPTKGPGLTTSHIVAPGFHVDVTQAPGTLVDAYPEDGVAMGVSWQ